MRSAWMRNTLPALLIALLALFFFRQLIFSDMILARGDTFNYFYPYWDARNAAFRAGELPLWTNDLFMGLPLLANPQLGVYYPLNWLTAPFRAPTAIKISILLHSALAGIGMLFLYRQVAGWGMLPALVAALIYSFSGYLGAHVEQINQYQGYAWLPLLVALYHRALTARSPWRDGTLLALAWALQIFCGHTQTVFISGVGLGVYGIGLGLAPGRSFRRPGRHLLVLAACALIALLLALPQLLPSLELASLSNRGGGFTVAEATAFSLPPQVLGRALLPSYDGQVFGEYVAYLGLIGLGLALWALLTPSRQKRLWAGLALVGLALAFGRYNPLYLLLAELPGFDLFRVPARFLVLFTLGMSMLAGLGLEALAAGGPRDSRRVALVGLILAALILLAGFLLQPDALHIFGGVEISIGALGLWVLALLALLLLLVARQPWMPRLALICVLIELLLAGSNMPYNDLSPPDVYLGERFSIGQLLDYQEEVIPPGRTLSITQLYFDPEGIGDLRARFAGLGMDLRAQFHALDAVKKQETLQPNQGLTWGIPTIDGFGGGITPTNYYSQLSSLLLPDGAARAVDGRLGERMALPECRAACIPDLRWLQLTDTRYIIIDKVYDIWHEDIGYDTGLAVFWADVPAFDWSDERYDQARILHLDPLPGSSEAVEAPGDLLLTLTDRAGLNAILAGEHSIQAVTLVDSGNPADFEQVQPPPWWRLASTNIKIYAVPATRSRAYLAAETRVLPDAPDGQAAALQLLRAGGIDLLHGDVAPRDLPAGDKGEVTFVDYSDERAALKVTAPAAAWLILADAWYPGWEATVNGEPVRIERANVMFRALPVPAGESEVVFQFAPQMWRNALAAGVICWLIALAALGWLWRR